MSGQTNRVTERDIVDEIHDIEFRINQALLALVREARALMASGRDAEALALLRSSNGRITRFTVRS